MKSGAALISDFFLFFAFLALVALVAYFGSLGGGLMGFRKRLFFWEMPVGPFESERGIWGRGRTEGWMGDPRREGEGMGNEDGLGIGGPSGNCKSEARRNPNT